MTVGDNVREGPLNWLGINLILKSRMHITRDLYLEPDQGGRRPQREWLEGESGDGERRQDALPSPRQSSVPPARQSSQSSLPLPDIPHPDLSSVELRLTCTQLGHPASQLMRVTGSAAASAT